MDRRRLPVGIQTFRRIREEGYYYVDKTAFARRVAADSGTHYFLSRPRRFGKSLFLDTLKELYEGAEPLFRGLAVHDGWDWSKRRPVVRLSFAGGNFKRPDALAESATAQIEDVGRRAGIDAGGGSPPVRFRRLIETLRERTGERVVVLVDEYDKPILDARDETQFPGDERGAAPRATARPCPAANAAASLAHLAFLILSAGPCPNPVVVPTARIAASWLCARLFINLFLAFESLRPAFISSQISSQVCRSASYVSCHIAQRACSKQRPPQPIVSPTPSDCPLLSLTASPSTALRTLRALSYALFTMSW